MIDIRDSAKILGASALVSLAMIASTAFAGPPPASTPPMGWNSWNHFAAKIDDATVRAQADAMVSSGMRDAGYRYINIDDAWEGRRDARGVIHPNAKFPDMKALADYVHSKGLKLGIYSSPGPKTCAGYEGSQGHEAQDAQTYAAWGVDYLKYDLCSLGLFNLSDLPANMEVDFTDLGRSGAAKVRDVWAIKDLGSLKRYKTLIPAHGVVPPRLSG
jgi:alpha-galactosidase